MSARLQRGCGRFRAYQGDPATGSLSTFPQLRRRLSEHETSGYAAQPMTQNPKTDTEESRGKLEQESWRGDEDYAQERTHGREIVAVLRQVEAGARVAEICRKVGISQATYYMWKRQYAGVGVSELRELRQLREENGRLKRLVADLSMDRQILQEIVSKKL